MKIAIYPGSFDPVTRGHLDIIRRASNIVDKLYIAVLRNSAKNSWFTPEERMELIEKVTRDIPNVEVISFNGLTAELCREKNAGFIVRGLRAVTDFEYELQLAQINHRLNEQVDTIFFTTSAEYSYVSSSIVKEVAMYGGDISTFVKSDIIDDVFRKSEEIRSRK